MISFFKKRWKDFQDTHRHLSYVPKDSADPVYNLNELVELSKRYGAGFKINGDHKKFTIVLRTGVLLFYKVIISLYLITFTGMAIYSKDPVLFFITLGGLLFIILVMKISPLLFYNIIVDTYERQITVKSIGLIGKWIRSGFRVDFNEFSQLSSQMKARNSYTNYGVVTTDYVNRIFIEYGQQKRPVIDLRNEINHHVFIICLTRLIKQQ